MASNGSMRNVGTLKFGLVRKQNTSKSILPSTRITAKPKPVSSFFDDDDDDDDDDQDDSNSSEPLNAQQSLRRARERANHEIALAAQAAALKAQREQAKMEGTDVYDYDGVYDKMKEQEEVAKRKRDLGDVDVITGKKKPRYMSNLLQASFERKVELERVEDRKVAREREAEGDMYGDKDTFVTEAYKERKKELKRLEEEEKRREALQRSGADMTEFYRNLLESHDSATTTATLSPEEIAAAAADREKRAKEKAQEEEEQLQDAIRRGEVTLNASNEIVDKRALLRGGLNISKTKIRSLTEEREAEARELREAQEREARVLQVERERKQAEFEKRRAREEQARRLLEETERQKVESEKRRLEAEEKAKMEALAKLKKVTTEEGVMDARARYLARKKAAEERAAASGDEDSD